MKDDTTLVDQALPTQAMSDPEEKVYCKDCKFRNRLTGCCTPFRKINVVVDDYYSPKHKVRKIEYGTYEMRTHNVHNECKHYRRRRE